MATRSPESLPLYYRELVPLSPNRHGSFRTRAPGAEAQFAASHAVPLTTDEFVHAQRHFPIVFTAGERSTPLALLGLSEGVNVFAGDEDRPGSPVYVPAYVRRYPYLLARVRPDAEELSLCFDPHSGLVGDFADGEPLFTGKEPSETTLNILKFCEDFEKATARTERFMQELTALDLLVDSEISIQEEERAEPRVYRGFRRVDEDRVRRLPGDTLARLNDSGALNLILAHIFSMSLVRDLFDRQAELGKLPAPQPVEA